MNTPIELEPRYATSSNRSRRSFFRAAAFVGAVGYAALGEPASALNAAAQEEEAPNLRAERAKLKKTDRDILVAAEIAKGEG